MPPPQYGSEVPSEANWHFETWFFDGKGQWNYHNLTITIPSQTANSTHTLSYLCGRQAVVYPNITVTRGTTQTFRISYIPFVTMYDCTMAFRDSSIGITTPNPFNYQIFGAVKIGLRYSMGQATSWENCLNRETSNFVEYISGLGSSNIYNATVPNQWDITFSTRTDAPIGTFPCKIDVWGDYNYNSGGGTGTWLNVTVRDEI
jgi:hypothetical protein